MPVSLRMFAPLSKLKCSLLASCLVLLLLPVPLFPFSSVLLFPRSPLLCLSESPGTASDEGIRIDLPAGGHVRIENQFGEVDAEVWGEKYVSIWATIEKNVAFTRSPVVIESKNQVLSISIIRTPVDPTAGIRLTVKFPEGAHAEIVTGTGSIFVRGLSASASLKSISGDIRAELPDPLNADINARSTSGVIRSELAAPLSLGGHLLQTRIGKGERVLRINSDSGQITLASAKQENDLGADEARTPTLAGSEAASKGAGTPAKEAESEEVSEGDIIRVDSQLVTLNMSVVDRNTNRGLVGLDRADFRLYEEGAEQQILQFDSSSAPFDLMLLIDLSGSTRDVVNLIRAAALRFIQAARPSDRIGVITFAGEPTLVSPPTLDGELLRKRVNAIDTATGETKLYDAADFAIRQTLKGAKNSRRTAIVLMSDGLDGTTPGVHGQIGSKLPYSDLLSQVREFDGVLYSLWLNTYYEAFSPQDTQPEAFDMGHDRMKELAEAGGGTFYEVRRLEDLAGAYERVVADLGTVYSLAYRPTNKSRDGKWRAISVIVDRPTAVARGKRGYYAN